MKCQTCEEIFSTRVDLKQHKLTHKESDGKSLNCQISEKGFYRESRCEVNTAEIAVVSKIHEEVRATENKDGGCSRNKETGEKGGGAQIGDNGDKVADKTCPYKRGKRPRKIQVNSQNRQKRNIAECRNDKVETCNEIIVERSEGNEEQSEVSENVTQGRQASEEVADTNKARESSNIQESTVMEATHVIVTHEEQHDNPSRSRSHSVRQAGENTKDAADLATGVEYGIHHVDAQHTSLN